MINMNMNIEHENLNMIVSDDEYDQTFANKSDEKSAILSDDTCDYSNYGSKLDKKSDIFLHNTSNKNNENKSDISSDDNMAYENWKGLGAEIKINPPKKRPKRFTKYMQVNKDIENSFNKRNMRSNLNSLLINGGMSEIVKVKNQRYLVTNTCAFDSVAVIISRAYVDNSLYTKFVDNSTNQFLKFCKAIACDTAIRNIYKDRVQLLKDLFLEKKGISGVRVIDANCNVTFIISSLFQNIPSATDHITCTNTDCLKNNKDKNYRTIVLDDEDLKKISNLEILLESYTEEKNYKCPQPLCKGNIYTKRILNSHIFIEMDQITENHNFSMADFFLELNVNKVRFSFHGSVNYSNSHYTSHIRRLSATSTWKIHNDLVKKIKKFKEPENIIVKSYLLVNIKS